ncbi:RNA polymerase sigma factor [Chondrinema litorale]|uniref:RNA polymerase sigma factor n=1 Tax=Chondrinema litorale TaxID=2994555 RepID=UPI002543C28A|nr:sigma-70 family RNA polymerase sigma factor [Chondrinema litorale]UZR96264.1 sigma-70 family RNA polymerase sigma factor [Chondrinema litorale]
MKSENLIDINDQGLWDQLKNGSEKALEIIYQQNYQILFSFGYKFISDKSTVKDEIQELFTNLWKNHHKLSKVEKIRPYLLKALYNSLIKKKQKSSKEVVIQDYNEFKYEVIFSIEQNIIEQEESEGRLKKIQEGLNLLSKREREIIYLFFYEGYNYNQIEDITGLKYQSIKNLMHRAIQRLKNVIYLASLLLISQLIWQITSPFI